MNCDQAFDVMTSSHGAHDRELHNHLDQCPRCREMRQTLEPALGMLQADALLTSVWEPLSADSEGPEIATRAARRLVTAEAAPNRGATSLWGYAGAIVLGAGLVWGTFMMNPATLSLPEIHRGETTCLYREKPRMAGITGQQMTQSCLACHSVAGSR